MLTVAEAIIVGVVSGVLSSALIFAAVQIGRNIILPWYTALVYEGAVVSGDWYSAPEFMEQEIKLELVQNASSLSGQATFVRTQDAKGEFEPLRSFEIRGTIEERFVHLVCKHSDRARLGRITFLLQVVGDGRRLEGVGSLYGVRRSDIGSVDITFYRDPVHLREVDIESEVVIDDKRYGLVYRGRAKAVNEDEGNVPSNMPESHQENLFESDDPYPE